MAQRNKSAEKRHRQNVQRNLRNRHVKSTVRTYIKRFESALQTGDQAETNEALNEAVRHLYKAASKGVLHKRTVSRKVSRLMQEKNRVAQAE